MKIEELEMIQQARVQVQSRMERIPFREHAQQEVQAQAPEPMDLDGPPEQEQQEQEQEQEQEQQEQQEQQQEQPQQQQEIGPDIGDNKCMVIQPIFYNNVRGIWYYDGNEEERAKICNSLLHSVNGRYVEFRTYFLVHYSDDYFEEMDIILKGVLGGEEIQLAFDILKIIDGKYDELDLENPEYVAELDDIINNDCYDEDDEEDLEQE